MNRQTVTLDRRSGQDRRRHKRYSVNFEIEWECAAGRKSGMMSDISVGGCFILASGEVENGETIMIYLPSNNGALVQFWGEVVNHVFEIGFAVKFVNMSEAQVVYIKKIIATLED